MRRLISISYKGPEISVYKICGDRNVPLGNSTTFLNSNIGNWKRNECRLFEFIEIIVAVVSVKNVIVNTRFPPFF